MATPYERIKAAWEAIDRQGSLNRVVELMAAEGTPREDVDAALVQLLLEIRAAGADDDTEEIINQVGDRIHGWCHVSRHVSFQPVTRPTVSGNTRPASLISPQEKTA